MSHTFAEIILPLPIPNAFTYYVPEELVSSAKPGKRAEVQFGRSKHYSGIIKSVYLTEENTDGFKPLLHILDEHPIISEEQMNFWYWIAEYYCCTIGEVMNIALPPGLKLSSETIIYLNPDREIVDSDIINNEVDLLIEMLNNKKEITLEFARTVIKKKSITNLINHLIDKEIILVREEIVREYKVKTEWYARLLLDTKDKEAVSNAFELTKKSIKQTNALLLMIQESKDTEWIRRHIIYKQAGSDQSVMNALEKKGLIAQQEFETSRLKQYDTTDETNQLSPLQSKALEEIEANDRLQPTLLHGITGSGKTRIFIELIEKTIATGGQVLYISPEITLTTYLTERLKGHFGTQLHPYHSHLNSSQRVDIWDAVKSGFPIILGTRSAIFLPFQNLQLIIVDEEHDESHKNVNIAPRFNTRDCAIVLSKITGSKIILGSATPSLESYHNAITGKYQHVKLEERYFNNIDPELIFINIKESEKITRQQFQISEIATDCLTKNLKNKEQSLVYINRRGYAPLFECNACAWVPQCINCDVSLTYHRFTNKLHCHYCGTKQQLPKECPKCRTHNFNTLGAGTQKIEDEISIFLPESRIERVDVDNARSQNNLIQIFEKIDNNEIDIVVGTKMVTKGIDFQNISLALIVNADLLFQFPNFRSTENGLQQLLQIKGRIGRKQGKSQLLIQTTNPKNPLFKYLYENTLEKFYQEELESRAAFFYPPYSRLIHIIVKHKNYEFAEKAAVMVVNYLKQNKNIQVVGPATPMVSRIRNYYHRDVLIKLPHDNNEIKRTKKSILYITKQVEIQQEIRGVKFVIDIDPR